MADPIQSDFDIKFIHQKLMDTQLAVCKAADVDLSPAAANAAANNMQAALMKAAKSDNTLIAHISEIFNHLSPSDIANITKEGKSPIAGIDILVFPPLKPIIAASCKALEKQVPSV